MVGHSQPGSERLNRRLLIAFGLEFEQCLKCLAYCVVRPWLSVRVSAGRNCGQVHRRRPDGYNVIDVQKEVTDKEGNPVCDADGLATFKTVRVGGFSLEGISALTTFHRVLGLLDTLDRKQQDTNMSHRARQRVKPLAPRRRPRSSESRESALQGSSRRSWKRSRERSLPCR